jgi:hypothetical protein
LIQVELQGLPEGARYESVRMTIASKKKELSKIGQWEPDVDLARLNLMSTLKKAMSPNRRQSVE